LRDASQNRARLAQRNSNELTELRNAQKIAKAQSIEKANQHKRRLARLSNAGKLDDLQSQLGDELERRASEIAAEKSAVLQNLQAPGHDTRIRALELEFQKVSDGRSSLASKYDYEATQLSAAFEVKKASMVIDFERRRETLRKQHELSRLSAILNRVPAAESLSHDDQPPPEFDDPSSEMDPFYNAKLAESSVEIQGFADHCTAEQLARQHALEGARQAELEEFGRAFREESAVQDVVEEYRPQIADLSRQLSLIVVPTVGLSQTADGFTGDLEYVGKSVATNRQILLNEFQLKYAEAGRMKPAVYECEEGDERERDRLREEFRDRIKEADTEIESLRKTLEGLVAWRSPAVCEKPEQTADELRMQLSMLESHMKQTVSTEVRKTIELLKVLRAELERLSCRHEDEMRDERARRTSEHEGVNALMERQQERMRRNAETYEAEVAAMEAVFTERNAALAVAHKEAVRAVTTEIEAAKARGQPAVEQDGPAKEKMAGLEKKLAEEMRSFAEALQEARRVADEEVQRAKSEWSRMQQAAVLQGGRQEEQSVIERLEATLKMKTKLLAQIGRDFLDFREGLHLRDGEFTQRFGILPSVAIVKHPATRQAVKRHAASRKEPLPPLGKSVGSE
jgi:hypothetical protein